MTEIKLTITEAEAQDLYNRLDKVNKYLMSRPFEEVEVGVIELRQAMQWLNERHDQAKAAEKEAPVRKRNSRKPPSK